MTRHEKVTSAIVQALETVDAGRVYGYVPWVNFDTDLDALFVHDGIICGAVVTRTSVAPRSDRTTSGQTIVTGFTTAYEIILFQGLDTTNPGGAESIIQARAVEAIVALSGIASLRTDGVVLSEIGEAKLAVIELYGGALVLFGARIPLTFEVQGTSA